MRAPASLNPVSFIVVSSWSIPHERETIARSCGLPFVEGHACLAHASGQLTSRELFDTPQRDWNSCARLLSTSVISMRRFLRRPSASSFDATGEYSPRPDEIIRSGGTPATPRNPTTVDAGPAKGAHLHGNRPGP